MKQRNVMKNVASTVLALGLSFPIASNSTMLVYGNESLMGNYSEYGNIHDHQINSAMQRSTDNIYKQKKVRNLDKEAGELFGNMRDATTEERESIDNYIKGISKNTGVDFFDLC